PYLFLADTATPQLSPLSLHDALPILEADGAAKPAEAPTPARPGGRTATRPSTTRSATRPAPTAPAEKSEAATPAPAPAPAPAEKDRKSTRLNSSHVKISYAVFCLKKK